MRNNVRPTLLAGPLLSVLFLAISRSVLMPPQFSSIAPIVASAFTFLSLALNYRQLRIRTGTLMVSALALVFVVSTALAGDLDKTRSAAGIAAMWVLAYMCGENFRPYEWRRFAQLVVIVAGVETVVLIGESVLGASWIRDQIAAPVDGPYVVRANLIVAGETNRAEGTLGYPIPMAHFLSISLVIVLFSSLIRTRSIRIVAACCLFAGILLTGTRTGVVSTIVALGVAGVLWIRERSTISWLPLAAGAGAAAIALGTDYISASSMPDDFSIVHRMGVVQSVWAILNVGLGQALFGSGYLSHERFFESGLIPGDQTFAVDNAFVSIMIAAGLIGLGLLGFLMWRACRGSNRTALTLISVSVVFGLSYDFVYWHFLMYLFCVLIGGGGQIESFSRRPKLAAVMSEDVGGIRHV